jgi:pimeloyl-ACP methyl ester carboxylesterase
LVDLPANGSLDLGDQQLEYRFVGPQPDEAPTLVLLHEGLGCVGLWGDFPDRLAAATSMGVFVYSRAGYGASSTVSLPRPLTYMHEEAQKVLPRVLDAVGFRSGILIGHSDGASIAAIYQGSVRDERARGLSLIAPHFFVEEMGLVEIAKATVAFESGKLREKLSRWHKHVDAAFLGWNGAWLDPAFRAWDIRKFLHSINVPVQVVQGADDQYGTMAQIEVAKAECPGPVEVVILDKTRHAPHREATDRTVAAISEFAIRVLRTHDRAAGAPEQRVSGASMVRR